ncbi:MAG: lysophospholipid acyltransferase family protein [Prevotellaceae bacterium]|nr:lysophospholipid acyltransferase family protein [Prevotellaceae bacterium]
MTTFVLQKAAIALARLVSRLPLGVLYALSTLACPVVRHVAGYRRGVVRRNIDSALPELTRRERRRVERRFYAWFCDYAVETLRLCSMSEAEMRRRLTVEGLEAVEAALRIRPFVFIYLGHYCNWEWISSLPLHTGARCAQLYKPLRGKLFDDFFQELRTRFGSENIAKSDALRRIVALRREGRPVLVGFISDQSPKSESTHLWVDFLHHDTAAFTGTERIGRKVGAAVFFADVSRPARGRYHLRFVPMAADASAVPEHELTRDYMARLEKMIRREPHLWLWSHNRWKHQRPAGAARTAAETTRTEHEKIRTAAEKS